MMGFSSRSVKSQLASSAWDAIALPATPLFGTDGIRGRVGEILNAQLALQLGFWAGQVLQSHTSGVAPVIFGQDSRNSSDMLAMALSAGLTAAGLDVWHLGLCPTGMVAYLTNTSKAIASVMISASHNPPEDNGIKFFGNGSKLADPVQASFASWLKQSVTILLITG